MGPDWKFGVNGTELVEGEEEKLVGMFSASDLTKEVGRLEVSSPAYIPPTQPRTQLHLASLLGRAAGQRLDEGGAQ